MMMFQYRGKDDMPVECSTIHYSINHISSIASSQHSVSTGNAKVCRK